MHPIIDIIVLFQISGQSDFNCFQSFGFSTGSCHLAILFPGIGIVHISLPAIGLHMGGVTDVSFITGRNIVQFDLNPFDTFGLSAGSGDLTVLHPALPAISLDMGLIRQHHLAVIHRNLFPVCI